MIAVRCLSGALAVAALWATAAPQARSAEPKASTKPNIIVIVGDDMGYHDIGVHGCTDCPTPNIDSLAKNGVRCTNGYVSGPYCSPTRAGLLTGRYQTRFGHEFNPGPPGLDDNSAKGLDLKQTTMADRLKAAGYATGMVGKWHLGATPEYHPLSRGFDEYFGFLGGAYSYFPDKGAKNDTVYRGREPAGEKEYLTDAFAREAAAFVERHQKEPFFLYLTFNAVHTPMEATEKYLRRFEKIADPKRRTYCAMMSAMDDAIGAVLGKLRATGVEENTLVFFISDNGGPQQSNGSDNTPLRGDKSTTWEGGVRVPFLMQWPARLPRNKTYDKPVIQIDILPTALAAAGSWAASPGDGLEGVNLLPFIEAANEAAPHDALYGRFGPQMAIRKGVWKLSRSRDFSNYRDPANKNEPPLQLFNLADDIGEKNNLAEQHPEKVKELLTAWQEWDKRNVTPSWSQVNKPRKPGAAGGKAGAKNGKKRAAATK